ncbi:MAG: adenylate/guanylate cyclase domain-containing protein [Boseongicola sp.]
MQIETWLKDLQLGHYAESFAENGVDVELLPDLTNDDLKDLGVARLADRKLLLKAIEKLIDGNGDHVLELSLSAPPEGEKRQVTVLFADLSNFTKISNELGSEATHALLNRYFETVDGVVEGYGGAIDKHIGDNVMAVFGAPVAHTDDPERAVRASLDIHAAMANLSVELDRPLTAHIGIASGQVVASGTGSDSHREYTVTGDTVNLASRLQDQAGGGETLISSSVHKMVSGLANFEPLGETQVKGLEVPVQIWRIVGMHPIGAAAEDSLFVGRSNERRLFSGILEECLESGCGQSLLVRGQAGIGKSRLIAEFTKMAREQGFAAFKGLVLDFGVGKGQDAIRSLVRDLLGIPPGSTKRDHEEAARNANSAGTIDDDQRVFLYDLLDIPQPVEFRSLYDAMSNATRNNGKQAVVAQLLAKDTNGLPILVIIEDIHWADELTLAYMAAMATAVTSCQAILILTSRVQGDPLDQTWRASLRGSPLTTIDLGPLRKSEAESIASSLLDAGDEFVRHCVEKAEGNPLFLEQLMHNASEGAHEEVPGSIQSLVQARMDRLQPKDKDALQAASIIGQRFNLDGLRHLLGDINYECNRLVRHNLVCSEGDGYLFAHALVKDGAYASFLTDRRRELHLKAAEWFADRDLELRAEHLDRAESQLAVEAYRKASESRAAAYHYERALALITRGQQLAKDPGERSRMTCIKGDLLHDGGDSQASIEAYIEARELAVDEIQRCRAEIGYASVMRIVDRYDEAFECLGRAEQVAEKHNLHLELSKLHHLRGNLHFPLGEIDQCWEEHNKALECAREAGSPEWEARALGGLADAEYARGRHLTVDHYLDQCFELCHRHGYGRIEVANLSQAGGGGSKFYRGELIQALENSLNSDAMARTVGHTRAEIIAQLSCFICFFAMSELDQARHHVDRAKELIEIIGARRFMARAVQYEGKIENWDGNKAKALVCLRGALEISRDTSIQYAGPSILADIAFVTDDPAERAAALKEGEELLAKGSLSHNYFEFYGSAIDISLKWKDWDNAERYVDALEDYTRLEPLALCDLLIARGRTLAAFGRGQHDDKAVCELQRLRDEARHMGLKVALPLLDEALASC